VVVPTVPVGVPEIIPVEVSNDKPAGKPGLIDQLVAAPPIFVGVSVGMGEPVE
jgi:hypothetical protein